MDINALTLTHEHQVACVTEDQILAFRGDERLGISESAHGNRLSLQSMIPASFNPSLVTCRLTVLDHLPSNWNPNVAPWRHSIKTAQDDCNVIRDSISYEFSLFLLERFLLWYRLSLGLLTLVYLMFTSSKYMERFSLNVHSSFWRKISR